MTGDDTRQRRNLVIYDNGRLNSPILQHRADAESHLESLSHDSIATI